MSDLSHLASPIENVVESICNNLIKKSTEFWEDRNKGILDLTKLVLKYENASSSTLYEVFNINVYRSLIDPRKQMILDLRAQQVRDPAMFLTHLCIITKDLMRFLLREIFDTLILAVKVPNNVMSGYVDDCIMCLIRNTIFKSAIPSIIGEFRESKSKSVREKCLVSQYKYPYNYYLCAKTFNNFYCRYRFFNSL
jgi:hypothetical protein